jgi:membrane dipeptidase
MRRPTPEWRGESPWLAETVVCDGLLPWANKFLPPGGDLGCTLARFRAVEVDQVSVTAADGSEGPMGALRRLASRAGGPARHPPHDQRGEAG